MLNYKRTGSGNQTLVLIHGYCENNTCFNEQVLFFKDICNVLTLDLPGFGKTPSVPEITIEEMAQMVNQVLVQEKIESCIILGHSMGGYVTLAFAELFPNKLKGFGLIHSIANADTEERKDKRKQVISYIRENGKEKYIKNFIPGLFTPNAQKDIIEYAIEQGLVSDELGIIEAAQAMMLRPDRQSVLRNTSLPVYFVIGKNDQLIPEAAMFAQAAICQKSMITYLEKSAHMGMMEEPKLLNIGINKFLALAK
jgi:pimeloyl-ACP methyl ester carboxylesterase